MHSSCPGFDDIGGDAGLKWACVAPLTCLRHCFTNAKAQPHHFICTDTACLVCRDVTLLRAHHEIEVMNMVTMAALQMRKLMPMLTGPEFSISAAA
jgi:hypothetical protein